MTLFTGESRRFCWYKRLICLYFDSCTAKSELYRYFDSIQIIFERETAGDSYSENGGDIHAQYTYDMKIFCETYAEAFS